MEKKLFVMAAAIMMATANANAQEAKAVDAYFTADEMPDMRLFMPGPPDSTSVAFANDVSRYRIHLRSIRCCSRVPPPATVSVSIQRPFMAARDPSSALMSIHWRQNMKGSSIPTSPSPRVIRCWAGVRHS